MNIPHTPLRLHAMIAVAAALAAAAMAAMAVRTPEMWPLMPEALLANLTRIFGVNTQEQLADLEFLSLWLLAFLVVATLAYVARSLAELRRS